MPAHAKTVALKDELKTPTVVAPGAVRVGLGQLRPGVNQVSEQVSRIQQLLAAAEGVESDPLYEQKFESMVQTCRALQKHHDKVDEALHGLARLLREFQVEAVEFVKHVEADA